MTQIDKKFLLYLMTRNYRHIDDGIFAYKKKIKPNYKRLQKKGLIKISRKSYNGHRRNYNVYEITEKGIQVAINAMDRIKPQKHWPIDLRNKKFTHKAFKAERDAYGKFVY